MEFVEALIMGMRQKGLSEFTCKLPSDDISSQRPEAIQMPLSEFRQKVEALRAKILKTAPMFTVANIQELLELEYGILQIGDAYVYSQTIIMSSDDEDTVIRYRFRYIDDSEYRNRFVSAKISLTNQYNSSKTEGRKEV